MFSIMVAVFVLLCGVLAQAQQTPDPERDILVTFDNTTARTGNAGLGVPYQHRKRYAVARQARRDAAAVAREYSLEEVERWPIQSLSIYCFVFRVAEGVDRQSLITTLGADARIDSAQPLQRFETSLQPSDTYNDTYVDLQYGLDVLDIAAVHRTTRGAGIRIAIVDSQVDRNHEDLRGRVNLLGVFLSKGQAADKNHGTAIASVIGASSNNALGIVGIAPEATLELYVSCWSEGDRRSAVCDSFTLSQALDVMLGDPPNVLNLSLNGPHDPLLERLIQKALDAGVVVVAAGSQGSDPRKGFPSNMRHVIGVRTAHTVESGDSAIEEALYAPGDRILVAVPINQYDFRSGSSLAAAHVSGVVALLLANAPDQTPDTISSVLRRSQGVGPIISINACDAINLLETIGHCDR